MRQEGLLPIVVLQIIFQGGQGEVETPAVGNRIPEEKYWNGTGRGILDWFKIKDLDKLNPKFEINGTELISKLLDLFLNELTTLGLNSIPIPPFGHEFDGNKMSMSNGSLNGILSIQQVGDTLVTVGLTASTLRTAWGWPNLFLTVGIGVAMNSPNISYPKGNILATVENATLLLVIKFEHLTQALTLDEFQLSLGSVGLVGSGLGELLVGGTRLSTEIANRIKDPILFVFNTVVKGLVNSALTALRTGLLFGK